MFQGLPVCIPVHMFESPPPPPQDPQSTHIYYLPFRDPHSVYIFIISTPSLHTFIVPLQPPLQLDTYLLYPPSAPSLHIYLLSPFQAITHHQTTLLVDSEMELYTVGGDHGDRAVMKAAPKFWNTSRLPLCFRSLQLLDSFKKSMKTHLFSFSL